jgi:hypothetical protein
MADETNEHVPLAARGPKALGWSLLIIGVVAVSGGLLFELTNLNVVGTVMIGVGLGLTISRALYRTLS